jgi:hypothetical protein
MHAHSKYQLRKDQPQHDGKTNSIPHDDPLFKPIISGPAQPD